MNILLLLLLFFITLFYILRKFAESSCFIDSLILPICKIALPIIFFVLSLGIVIIGDYPSINCIYIIPYIISFIFFHGKDIYTFKKESIFYEKKHEYKKIVSDLVEEHYKIHLDDEDIIINFCLENRKTIKCIIKILINKSLEKNICSYMFELRDLLTDIYSNHIFEVYYDIKE